MTQEPLTTVDAVAELQRKWARLPRHMRLFFLKKLRAQAELEYAGYIPDTVNLRIRELEAKWDG